MKRFLSLLLLVVTAVFLVACNDDKPKNPGGDQGEYTLDKELSEQWSNFFDEKKLYLTTLGQADIDIVQNILAAAGISEEDFTRKEQLTAAEVDTNSVVLTVVGASAKGLGAAGIDRAHEENRAQAFATRAQNDEITVIVIHVGGAERRGDDSDIIINKVAPKAQLMLVADAGNHDGFFTNIAKNNGIEIALYSRVSNMKAAFEKLAGK